MSTECQVLGVNTEVIREAPDTHMKNTRQRGKRTEEHMRLEVCGARNTLK